MQTNDLTAYLHQLAASATCHRLSVGAVVEVGGVIVGYGSNRAVKNVPQCLDIGCLMVDGHCTRPIHAEQNAIIMARFRGVILKGATLYTTHFPCARCALVIVAAGIVRLLYLEDYRNSDKALQIMKGIKVEKWTST